MNERVPHVVEDIVTGARGVVITVSDSAASGDSEDVCGPELVSWLASCGVDTPAPAVVPDEQALIAAAITAAVESGARVVLTTGGTGIAPRDVTPEATAGLLERQLPGIPEAIRAIARGRVPTTDLSRGLAGVIGTALVVNLPGSRGGIRDGITVLDRLLAHALAQLALDVPPLT